MIKSSGELDVGSRTNQLLIPELQIVGTNSNNVGERVDLGLIEVACTFWRAKIILQGSVVEIDPWLVDVGD